MRSPLCPSQGLGRGLVRHAKMRGDAAQAESQIMQVPDFHRDALVQRSVGGFEQGCFEP